MKRLDVNAVDIWEPKKGDVLCSRHFKKTDFDRSTPNIKLKPGVIPSIFDSPSHSQISRFRRCLSKTENYFSVVMIANIYMAPISTESA
uniref:THAP domain containing 6 n=1 Tax=Monodon monoceros TaxID=40151 RepID=A0A8C6C3A5_MONMO